MTEPVLFDHLLVSDTQQRPVQIVEAFYLIRSNRLLRKLTLHTSRCWRKVARHSKLPDKTREGSNLSTEWRWADGRLERLPDLAAELVPLNVDVIVAGAFKPGQEARIVHWIQVEPVESHLARPANVGGSCDG